MEARLFTGGCGLFSFVFRGGTVAEPRCGSSMRSSLFGIGYSWGGFESLVVPVDPAGIRDHGVWPPAGLSSADCCGVRLAIGLEDPADLIADLEQALTAMAGG